MILVRVPGINGLGKTSGTREAGRKILKGLEGFRHEEIHVDNSNLVEQEELILKNARKLLEEEDKVVFIGGDHSISYSTVLAFVEKYSKGKLIVFDAHVDCMPPMKEPTHEEWLRGILDRTGLRGENVMIIGARDIEPEEQGYLEREGIKIVDSDEVESDIDVVVEKIREFISEGEVYVSFDIDVFDDSIVKATGYPVAGGLGVEEVMKLLDVVLEGDVRGMDLVEVNLDFSEGEVDRTVDIARKVLGKFIKN